MARILVIDDDYHIRQLLRLILEAAHHTVLEAGDGKQAMRITRDTTVDLIITDILMPEQDGLEVIREMKRKEPTIKIIALSGGGAYLGLETLETAKIFGALETMAKPFDVHELIQLVEKSLGQ